MFYLQVLSCFTKWISSKVSFKPGLTSTGKAKPMKPNSKILHRVAHSVTFKSIHLRIIPIFCRTINIMFRKQIIITS